MILFAAAIKIHSSAVKTLGTMDWGDMANGLVGVGVLLAEVEVFLNTAKFSGKTVLTATGFAKKHNADDISDGILDAWKGGSKHGWKTPFVSRQTLLKSGTTIFLTRRPPGQL